MKTRYILARSVYAHPHLGAEHRVLDGWGQLPTPLYAPLAAVQSCTACPKLHPGTPPLACVYSLNFLHSKSEWPGWRFHGSTKWLPTSKQVVMEVASYHNLHRPAHLRKQYNHDLVFRRFWLLVLYGERLVSNQIVYEALACDNFIDANFARSEPPPASPRFVQYDQDFISSVIDKQRKLSQKIIVATTSSAETLPFPHRKTATQEISHWQSRELDNTRVS